ncbi:MAG: diacylglycerol kinase family protein [Planctomycetales bacterium]|nr:diacylglycerol kinase family protein [Planctomycetales bacterium]
MANDFSPVPDEVDEPFRKNQSWVKRFAVACRGVKVAVRLEASFFVHLFVAAIVLLAGAVLGIARWEWCLVVLCIAAALSAELFNTSIERIARVVTRQENPEIRDALDTASGAVLVVALGSAIIGLLVFGTRAAAMLGY